MNIYKTITLLILILLISLSLYMLNIAGAEETLVQSSDHDHLFLKLDRDQNGYISRLESLAELPLNDSFSNFDTNNDKQLNIIEFRPYFNIRYGALVNAMSMNEIDVTPNKEDAFYLLDKDKNSVITIDEFASINLDDCDSD